MNRFVLVGAASCIALAITLSPVSANDTGAHSVNMPSLSETARLDYDLDAVRRGEAFVPAVFATELPAHLTEIRETRLKKRTFIRLVLPLILENNTRITMTRDQLITIAAKTQKTDDDRLWLKELAWDYEVDPTGPDLIQRLLQRIDVIPPSLAIAQSITESGWGTSRFAHSGRALYGQRTWSRGGGIVPKQRRSGEKYEVRAFRSLLESVASYMRNLNTHPAYAAMRAKRALDRQEGRAPSGHAMAAGLDRYAETGQQYIDDLRAIMRVNRLSDFDKATFRTSDDRIASL
jgi:Bax protein